MEKKIILPHSQAAACWSSPQQSLLPKIGTLFQLSDGDLRTVWCFSLSHPHLHQDTALQPPHHTHNTPQTTHNTPHNITTTTHHITLQPPHHTHNTTTHITTHHNIHHNLQIPHDTTYKHYTRQNLQPPHMVDTHFKPPLNTFKPHP